MVFSTEVGLFLPILLLAEDYQHMCFLSTKYLFIFFISIISCSSCLKEVKTTTPQISPPKDTDLFDSLPVMVSVTPVIREASGLADSKKNPGYLWVEEDSGNPNELSLLNHSGSVKKKIFIKGAVNRDWEDIVLSGNTLYIGDIGDNNAVYPTYTFYTFPEPDITVDTITNLQKIAFQYPDGSHDAEAFLVEPTTSDIYIVTKRDFPSRIYKLAAPISYTVLNTAQFIGTLTYNGIVSAALSQDNKQIILKTYFGLSYYTKAANGKIEDALMMGTPISIPYTMEPQGEAVCFAQNDGGYFTISEASTSTRQLLYFYKRN